MRKFVLFLVLVVLVAVGAVIAAAYFIPADVYKAKIEQQASAVLGRQLHINGKVSLNLWPGLQAEADNVTLANPPGFAQADFATMKSMRAGIALLPLLSRKVQIKHFILIEPIVVLERRKNGAVNWIIGPGGQANKGGAGSKAPVPGQAGFTRTPGALPLQASLGKVRLVNGDVRYLDRAAGVSQHIGGINLDLSMPSLSAPMTLKGRFSLDGRDYRLEASLAGLKPFLDGARTALTASLDSDLFSARFDGAFDQGGAIAATGDLALDIPSVRKLAEVAGTPLGGADNAYGAFHVSGTARVNTKRLSFDNADLRFDDIAAKGRFTAQYGGAKPALSGAMDIERLDITPYLPPQAPPGQSIPPWSTQAFDLGMLNALNAKFTLTLGALQMRQVKIGKSVLKTVLADGRLQAALTQMALYGGTGSGAMVADARSDTPSFSLTGAVAGVRFLPLLSDAVRFKRLDGTGAAQFSVRGTGTSQAAVMKALQGKGNAHLKDGRIIGVNLAEVLRSAQGFLSTGTVPAKLSAGKATDFSDLEASFTIKEGIARTDDFIMLSPLLRVPGQGTLDIGGQSVDFRLRPRAVASLKGQGGKADLKGFEAPFRIHGPWNAVRAGLDKGVLKQRAKRKAGALIDKNLGKDSGTGTALKSLLGVPQSSSAPAKTPDQSKNADEEKALDALSGLFKKKKKKKQPPN